MGIRFRKSLKLAPGIRMNFSGSGISWTLGPRGASVGIGKRGTFLNTGVPGTGLYSRQQLSSNTSARQNHSSRPEIQTISITVSIDDDGVLLFKDEQGNLIPEAHIEAAKKQQGEKIKALIQQKCDEINSQVESLGEIHLHTSPPLFPRFEPEKFDVRKPMQPILKSPGIFCRFFKSCIAKVELENKKVSEEYAIQAAQWEKQKVDFEAIQAVRSQFIDRVLGGDVRAIEQYIEDVLQDIVWPRETLVDFDVRDDGVIALDVDLPEIEEMPTKTAMVPQRGYRLSIKEIGVTQVQKLYMRHVHAVGFRMVGEMFAVSPFVKSIVLSAYSQRPNKATGQIGNEYLYSVRVSRDGWVKINFDNLSQIDVVEALGYFDLRRDMTKTGIFKPIEPFSP